MRIADAWKPGRKREDTGIVFLVAVEDRKLRVLTGYGLEGILPDGLVGEIEDREIVPAFRAGQMDEGIWRGVVALAGRIAAARGVELTGVSREDVLLLVGIGAVTLAGLALVYRPLTFATVDPEVAAARGVPVGALAVVFLLIMAAAVAEAIQVVGVLLILTLLITPGAAAERLTPRPGAATAWSVGIALFCVLGGIFFALLTNHPVSVFVTSLSFACYLLARFVVGPRRRDARAAQRTVSVAPTLVERPASSITEKTRL